MRLVLQALIRILLSLVLHKKYIRKEKKYQNCTSPRQTSGFGNTKTTGLSSAAAGNRGVYHTVQIYISGNQSINKCLNQSKRFPLSFLFLDFDLMHLLWCRKTVFIALTFRHVFNHSLVWPTPKPG